MGTVTQVISCCEDCQVSSSQLTCTQEECKFLCIHMYKCDPLCFDFNNGHLCKHIHRVHSLHSQLVEKVEIGDEVMKEYDVDFLSYAEPCKPPSEGIDGIASYCHTLHYANFVQYTDSATFDALIQELQDIVPKDDPSVLDHINALLQNAVLACRAAETQRLATLNLLRRKIPSLLVKR